jgi:hypothetical protein
MHVPTRWWSATAFMLASALALPALARADQASARFEPDTVAPGEAATLAVTTDDSETPELPSVAGVSIEPIGRQTQMTTRNGVTDQLSTYLYAVSADDPGEYTIAGIRVGATAVPAPTLHVVAGARSSRSSMVPPSAPGSRAERSEGSADLARMRLRLDERRLYAGQSVAFTVQAYFRGGTGVTVKGRPEFSSDAFVVSGLDDEPAQAQTTIDGVPYLAVTWRGALTAVKPGDHPLEVTMPVSLQYRELRAPSAQPSRNRLRDLLGGNALLDDMLNDPFFQSAFDDAMLDGMFEPGRLVQKDVTLRGRAGQAHVMGLPEKGKPADFSGAVGEFELTASLPSTELTQGEPVELQFAISGSGNFGQFSSHGVPDSPQWTTYEPQSMFDATDKLGLAGTASYVQPIAARSGGDLELPGVSFSYFDPKLQRYVTKTTPAIPVHVAPAEAHASADSASHGGSQAASVPDPDELAVRTLARGGVPTWLLPVGLATLVLALLGAGVALWRRTPNRARRLQRRRTKKLIARKRRAMLRAAREGDRSGYLRSGKGAIQQRLAAEWQVTPESITAHELELRWPDAPASIRRIFELADQAEYAGGRVEASPELHDLPAWSREVDCQIARMDRVPFERSPGGAS